METGQISDTEDLTNGGTGQHATYNLQYLVPSYELLLAAYEAAGGDGGCTGLHFTGHSLGGAIAQLVVRRIIIAFRKDSKLPICCARATLPVTCNSATVENAGDGVGE